MGSTNTPIQNIGSDTNKKRYRKKLDLLTNQEVEQEEDHHERRIKRRTRPADDVVDEVDLALLVRKLNLPCKRVQGEREPEKTATRRHLINLIKRKLTTIQKGEEEDIMRLVKRRTTGANSDHTGTKVVASIITSRKYGRTYNVGAPTFSGSSSTSINHLSNLDWASLPNDIVFLILLDKLLEQIDHVRFAAVCKGWRSVAKGYNQTMQRWCKAPPMLMIPIKSQEKIKHGLYGVSDRTLYSNIRLPVPYGEKCCGSSHGWLFTVDKSWNITLHNLNPYRNNANGPEAIHLPPIDLSLFFSYLDYSLDLRTLVIPRILLTADPTLHPKNYSIVAFFNDHVPLIFMKGGQKDWNYRYFNGSISDARFFKAIFYEKFVYAVRDEAQVDTIKVTRFDIHSCHDVYVMYHSVRSSTSLETYRCEKNYLVESTKGDLLLVRRFSAWEGLEITLQATTTFRVHKFVFQDNEFELIEETNIGDDALFVGDSHSVSVLASNFPMCKPNSIYYTCAVPNQYGGKACEICIFNLEDGTITKLDSLNNSDTFEPLWISPKVV